MLAILRKTLPPVRRDQNCFFVRPVRQPVATIRSRTLPHRWPVFPVTKNILRIDALAPEILRRCIGGRKMQ